jgi:hypothetical protein
MAFRLPLIELSAGLFLQLHIFLFLEALQNFKYGLKNPDDNFYPRTSKEEFLIVSVIFK